MRRDECYLVDMLGAARNAVKFTVDLSCEEFALNDLHQNATFKALDIVGSAANRISSDFKKLHTQIPWFDIISWRNRVVLAYFAMDLEVVWLIAHDELPVLIRELEAITPLE